jgi:transitional endoplasmic reticulum ATPase
MAQFVKLKVAEAIQDDVNKGVVRFDSNFIHQLDMKPGDIVEIEGERKTVSIVDRAYPGDIGLNVIRMDGLVRRNARTGIGEYVQVRKAEVEVAKKIIIAPSQQGIRIDAPPAIFRHRLLGRAVVKGDIISLGGVQRRKSALSDSSFFSDIFEGTDFLGAFGFMDFKFIVVDCSPKGAVIISDKTEIQYNPEAMELVEGEVLPEVTYEDIGGLSGELKKIRELVELPLKHPEIFEQLGIEPPKGVLLHGPPGTGKTLLAKAVANETNSNFILINGPEIMSKFYGESEANLRKKFEEAEKNAPSIIFIDEIDAIGAAREESKGEVERRVVAQLLAIMDGLKSRGKVVVIAATNIPNSLDPALRRPGRFDREIEIGVPQKPGRLNILKIHTRNMPLEGDIHYDILAHELGIALGSAAQRDLRIYSHDSGQQQQQTVEKRQDLLNKIKESYTSISEDRIQVERLFETLKAIETMKPDVAQAHVSALSLPEGSSKVVRMLLDYAAYDDRFLGDVLKGVRQKGTQRDLQELAEITHGFVGADLAALTRETAMVVLRKVLPDLSLEKDERIPPELLAKLKIRKQDFYDALHTVRPSALREVFVETPNVKWQDIGGLDTVKDSLIEAVEWPLKHPERFEQMGIRPPRGILLYGPPGTGKTLLAKAVANESDANFIQVKGPELISKWVGESERGIRKIFEKARQASPSIIFFDEMDSIAPRRGGPGGDNKVTERMVNQLLTEMDGLETLKDVVIIGASNRPDIMDPALLRPGRFDRILLISQPNAQAREKILRIHSRNMPLHQDVNLAEIAKMLDNYVGADIEAICREAAMLALRESLEARQVRKVHFEAALKRVRPSVSSEIIANYEQFEQNYSKAQGNQMGLDKQIYFG